MELIDWFFDALVRHAPRSIQIETTRYLVGAIGVFLIVWIGLHRILAHRKIRNPTPRRKQIQRELYHSAITVLVFMLMNIFVYEGAASGIFKFYFEIDQYGWAYLVGSIIALAVFHDAYFYWTHRLMHHPKLFRHFHAVHHRSKNPTPFTAYSFNAAEAAVNFMVVPIFAMLVPVHGVATLIYLWFMIVRNAVGHCGYELMPASWIRHPILGQSTSVTHHDMHHEKMNGNYALYFTWWDRWMGTEHKDYLERFDAAVAKAPAHTAGQGAASSDKALQPSNI